MKLMTIWRAHEKAMLLAMKETATAAGCFGVRDVYGFHAHTNEASKRFMQAERLSKRLVSHLQEWDDDIEELERLLDEI